MSNTLFSGCNKCLAHPVCPDAFTEVATECGNYGGKQEGSRPKSHWVKEEKYGLITHHCFLCKKKALETRTILCTSEEILSPFCPFCGAEMENAK